MIISLYECFGFFLRNNWCSNEITISFVLMMEIFIIQKERVKKNLEKRQNLWKKGKKNPCTIFTYKEFETIYKYSYTGIPRRKEND